jgi:cytochrome b561
MQLKNTRHTYGLVSRVLHWGMALAIFAMFGFGKWMRTLDYYSPWYKQAPHLHKSVGITLLVLLLARFVWRLVNQHPDDSHLKPAERKLGNLMHLGFYALLLVLMVAGYLISTVDGRSLDVFNLFSVPSFYQQKGLEDTFGFIHEWLAHLLIGLVVLHALAALKHHFIDRDVTLRRMWRG